MSKILITGTTGFVGRAVCKVLRDQGHMLTGTTRQPDQGAGPAQVPLYHIAEIGPDTDWSQIVSGADIVIHLAARVHVMRDRVSDPLAAFRRVNYDGTKNLAEQAAAAGVKRFVFISTAKVAGEISPPEGFNEKDPAQPEDPYGVSKWEAEQALAEISQRTGMELVILRPPLVYGPGVKGNFLKLINAVQREKLLPLGAIQNQRDLLYVENLADVIAVAAHHPNAAHQTFFVSDQAAVSTPALVQKIAAALNKKPRLINLPLGGLRFIGALAGKSSAIQRLCGSLTLDTAKIQRSLNWTPPYSLEEGLKKTAEWFKANSQA